MSVIFSSFEGIDVCLPELDMQFLSGWTAHVALRMAYTVGKSIFNKAGTSLLQGRFKITPGARYNAGLISCYHAVLYRASYCTKTVTITLSTTSQHNCTGSQCVRARTLQRCTSTSTEQ